jgi:hypothetical protein
MRKLLVIIGFMLVFSGAMATNASANWGWNWWSWDYHRDWDYKWYDTCQTNCDHNYSVPEPSTLLLTGSGLIGLWSLYRKRSGR